MKSTHTTPKRKRLMPLAFLALFVASTLMSLLPVPTALAGPGGVTQNCLDFSKYNTLEKLTSCRSKGDTVIGTMSLQDQVLAYIYMTGFAVCDTHGHISESDIGAHRFSNDTASYGIGIAITDPRSAGQLRCNATDWTSDALHFFDAKVKVVRPDDNTFSDSGINRFKFVCEILGMYRYSQDGTMYGVENCESSGVTGDYWAHPDSNTNHNRTSILDNFRREIYDQVDSKGNVTVANDWDIHNSGALQYMLYYLSLRRSCQARTLDQDQVQTGTETVKAADIVIADGSGGYSYATPTRLAWPTTNDSASSTMALAISHPYDSNYKDSILSNPTVEDCAGIVTTINNSNGWKDDYIKCALLDPVMCNAPGSATDVDTGVPSTTDDRIECGNGTFDILVCPFVKIVSKAIISLDGFIMGMLYLKADPIFDGTDNPNNASFGYYRAWASFRVIAIAILVIAGLIMVISQALGFELLDAYTIRKVLPRLLVAIIGISLSWPIMRLVVDFFNATGLGIRQLIYAPFQNMDGNLKIDLGTGTALLGGIVVTWFAMGPACLTFVLTALIAIIVGYLTLVVRQIAIVMLVIVAPVAIACYILPGTQRVWKLWSSNFMGLLLMFPIVSALIAAGHVFSAVAMKESDYTGVISFITNGFATTFHLSATHPVTVTSVFAAALAMKALAIIAYFIPYFMIPAAAGWSNKLLGQAAGAFRGLTKGMSDGLAKARSNARQKRHQERMAGTRGIFGRRGGAAYRAIANAPKNASWRPSRWRSNFRDMEQQIAERNAGEQLKAGGARAFNDDDASAAALHATSDRDFIRRYRAARRASGGDDSVGAAQAALSRARNALGGAQMGTRTMRVAAQHFRTSMTNSAYAAGPAGLAALRGDLRHLIDNGDITENDAAGWMKENNGRTDYSKNSYGGTLAFVQGRDADGNAVTDQGALALAQIDGAFRNADPRELIGGHGKAVESFAGHAANPETGDPGDDGSAMRNLGRAMETRDQRQIDYALADIASVHSSLSAISQAKGDQFAERVLSQPMPGVPPRQVPTGETRTRVRTIPGPPGKPDMQVEERYAVTEERQPTIREYIDVVRRTPADHPGFHDRSREYTSGYAASAAEAASAAVTPPDGH